VDNARGDILGSVSSDEVEKYQRCYQVETYHMQGARLEQVKLDIAKLDPAKTYLDVGCGRGETVKMAHARGVHAHGIDLVPELCDGKVIRCGSVTDLSLPDDAFDVVSCYDMLEHLPTDQVDKALDELWRVARVELVLSTNNKQSRLPLPEGGFLELHLTRKPRAWWELKFHDRGFRSIDSTTYGVEEWHWRIQL